MHSIRAATPADIPLILELIRALATYEREPDAVKTTEADLLRDGFGKQPCFECLIAESEDGEAAGFALYFYNYSTWRGRSGSTWKTCLYCRGFAAWALAKRCWQGRCAGRGARLRPAAMGRSRMESDRDRLLPGPGGEVSG